MIKKKVNFIKLGLWVEPIQKKMIERLSKSSGHSQSQVVRNIFNKYVQDKLSG